MKKLFKIIAIAVCVATLVLSPTLYGFTTSMLINPGVMTNFPTIPFTVNGPVKVTQIIISSSSTNVSNLEFVDTPTNTLTWTNAAYSNILSYATNVVTNYVNYYGRTNSYTNLSLVDVTNSVPAVTNNYNVALHPIITTNATATFQNVNYYFVNGLWITNVAAPGSGPSTVTITYQQ
jgi:hypothetical protein